MQLLLDLGFNINFKKSIITPSTNMLHLGYLWDTSNLSLSLPIEKIEKIKSMAFQLMYSERFQIKLLASFIGLLVSAHNGFRWAPLHFRNLQFNLISKLTKNLDWNAIVSLSRKARLEVDWWSKFSINVALSAPVHFSEIIFDLSLY